MSVAKPLMAVILGVVMMFVGIFLVSSVADVFPANSLYQTGATSNTSPVIQFSGTNTSNQTITVSTNATPTADLLVHIVNTTGVPSGTVQVLFNDVVIGNVTIPSVATVSTIHVTLVSGLNRISYYNGGQINNITNISQSELVYLDTSNLTALTGNVYTSTVNTTGTIFAILGLVLIIVGLAFAIRSINDFAGGGEG